MEITSYLSECIKTHKPVTFLKYGDGEYFAALGNKGCNCDQDNYTDFLKNGLMQSFTYMVDHGPNTFIGIMSWNGNHHDFLTKLVIKPIQIAKYHTIIMDNDHINDKIELLKTIKESPLKKIYICNPLMVRAKILLNIDHMVHVPFNNWIDTQFDDILNQVKSIIDPEEQYIILTSAGMGAKRAKNKTRDVK